MIELGIGLIIGIGIGWLISTRPRFWKPSRIDLSDAVWLDAMTFADGDVKAILDREDGYISHDELMKHVREARDYQEDAMRLRPYSEGTSSGIG